MKPRSLIAIVSLAAVALFGAACGTRTNPDNAAVSPTPADARTGLEAAFTKSDAETSSRMSVASAQLSMTIEIDRTAKVMHGLNTIEFQGRRQVTESLVVDGVEYMRSHEEGKAAPKWRKYEGTATSDFEKSIFASGDLLTDKSKITEVSPGEYRVEDGGNGKGLLAGMKKDDDDAPATMTFTLDAQGRVTEIEVETKDGTVKFAFEFGVTVSAKAPAASEIESK